MARFPEISMLEEAQNYGSVAASATARHAALTLPTAVTIKTTQAGGGDGAVDL
jgi:hypothetical protein